MTPSARQTPVDLGIGTFIQVMVKIRGDTPALDDSLGSYKIYHAKIGPFCKDRDQGKARHLSVNLLQAVHSLAQSVARASGVR